MILDGPVTGSLYPQRDGDPQVKNHCCRPIKTEPLRALKPWVAAVETNVQQGAPGPVHCATVTTTFSFVVLRQSLM